MSAGAPAVNVANIDFSSIFGIETLTLCWNDV
jgi:hypothetical protein